MPTLFCLVTITLVINMYFTCDYNMDFSYSVIRLLGLTVTIINNIYCIL